MRHILRGLAAALLWSTIAAAEPTTIEQARTQLISGQDAAAADTLIAVARRGHDAIAPLPASVWEKTHLRLEQSHQADRALALDLALIEAHYDGAYGRNGLAARSARALTERGRVAEALALVPQIEAAESVERLLVDRRYALLWPAIEQHANSNMAAIETKWVEIVAHEFAVEPRNVRRIIGLEIALRDAGRFAEIVTLLEPLTDSPESVALHLGLTNGAVSLGDAVWIVNDYAFSLARLDRADEADRLFAKLIALNSSGERGPQGLIVRWAQLLLGEGRYSASLDALAALDSGDWTVPSDARAWAQRISVCSLHALGRDAEMADVLAPLEVTKAENWVSYMGAMLCLDRPDAVEVALLARLADARLRSEALVEVQDVREAARRHFNAVLHARLSAVLARPAVAAAIQRWGRLLPPALRRTSTD